jgi:DNA-binding winged helix-turn-helix (wHTH) protein
MSDNNQDSYKFSEFRLDVVERLLLRKNLPIPLTPKVFDVLAVLVERSGHLVEKDEVLRVVWEDAFVEESTVARAVHELRKVLGEDAGHKFIETVPKKGYRFVAEVEKVSEPSAVAGGLTETFELPSDTSNDIFQPPATAEPSSDLPRKLTTRIILIAVGFLSVISLIALLAFNRQPSSAVNSNPPKCRFVDFQTRFGERFNGQTVERDAQIFGY